MGEPRFDHSRGHLLRDWQTDLTHLRQGMIFGRQILGMSLMELADFFGCHHTTVLEHLHGRRGHV